MAVVEIGTGVGKGATTVTGYFVQSYIKGGKEVIMKDIRDETKQLVTRLVFQTHEKVQLTMIPLTATDPESEFPMGGMATNAAFTAFFVDDFALDETGEEDRVTVSLTNIGITVA